MPHQCEFCPGEWPDECENIAVRQIFVRDTVDDPDCGRDGGVYMWVCESCIPLALKHWKEVEMEAEF
jgi:hypothetical protein